jgi:peptide deformylase
MIRLYGDPILGYKTDKVPDGIDHLKLEQKLLTVMHDAGGIGLAANQIGLSFSVFVMMLERGGTLTAINPEIESVDERTHTFEHDGCLSLPGISHATKRHDSITLKYQDTSGILRKTTFFGLEGVIVQHEMDHLNGKFYIDQLGKLKKSMLLKKYHKLTKKS